MITPRGTPTDIKNLNVVQRLSFLTIRLYDLFCITQLLYNQSFVCTKKYYMCYEKATFITFCRKPYYFMLLIKLYARSEGKTKLLCMVYMCARFE